MNQEHVTRVCWKMNKVNGVNSAGIEKEDGSYADEEFDPEE